MAGKRGTRAEVAARWRQRLARWRRDQVSITEFCVRERVSQQSFFLWRKRLAEEPLTSGPGAAPGRAFLPVEVVADPPRHAVPAEEPGSGAWLEISCGPLACRLPADIDEAALRRVVRVLCEEIPRC